MIENNLLDGELQKVIASYITRNQLWYIQYKTLFKCKYNFLEIIGGQLSGSVNQYLRKMHIYGT